MMHAIFGWKRVAAFAAFVVALSAWSWSGVLLTTKPVPFAELAQYFVSRTERTFVMYLPIYIAVSLADALPLAGRRRFAALAFSLLAGTALAVQLRCAVMPSQLLYVYGSIQLPYCDAFPTWRTYADFPASWLTPLTTAGLMMVFIFGRRRDAQLAEALHAASTAQIEQRRQRIESDLEAMRSRVDPDTLLATLRAVRAEYDRDPAEGERGLDRLIAVLREAAGRSSAPPAGAA